LKTNFYRKELILLAKSGMDSAIEQSILSSKLSEESRYMLKPDKDPGIPEMTRLIAREAFPQGNIFLTMRDELGPIFEDEQFRDLYPALGQPAVSPARLALVTVMQFVENLTDRQAAQAVRARIDWKYALGLELSDPGFNYSVLSEFRSRLIEGLNKP
jgi:transposase